MLGGHETANNGENASSQHAGIIISFQELSHNDPFSRYR